MTFKEKWHQDHPGGSFDPTVRCPSFYGYEECGSNCANPETVSDMPRVCGDCWNREMPPCEHTDPCILDSGELTTFETGAVRSDFNADGTRKGRCDLLPLRVLAKIWRAFDTSLPSTTAQKYYAMLKEKAVRGEVPVCHEILAEMNRQDYGADKAVVFEHIADFQDTGNAQHLVLALNSFTGYLDFPTAFLEVSKHYEAGAEKYGECNWQKGLPVKTYVNSMVRHYLKWLRGDTDEPHDRAFVWNVLCCLWECEFSPRAKPENEQDTPVMVLECVTKAQSNRVSYLCDRRACPACDNPGCIRTEDINHAVNFECVGEHTFAERTNSRLLLKNAVPGVYEIFGGTCLKGADSVVYDMATGCPINTTGLAFCQRLSLDNTYKGVEGLILSTAPGGALFFHEGDVWMKTAVYSDTESVYAVRLCDGTPKRIPGGTLVTSVEDFDFKLY